MLKLTILLLLGLVVGTMFLDGRTVLAVHPGNAVFVDDTGPSCPGIGAGTAADPLCTVQEGVDHAASGDTVHVAAGTYNENVLITTADIRLYGQHATLDGTGLGGFGIHVLDTSGVEIMGFVVEKFEVGVVLENVTDSQVHRNEIRENTSETRSLQDGMQLINADNNTVTNNFLHHNAHNGMTLKGGSSNNTVRGNNASDNGQHPGRVLQGCGIQLSRDANDNNSITANETLRNAWGILVPTNSLSTGNFFGQNRSHENDKAGIAVRDGTAGNVIGQNNAKGNGLADVPPSFTFDLFGDLDNTWQNNQGTFGEE